MLNSDETKTQSVGEFAYRPISVSQARLTIAAGDEASRAC